MDNRRSRRRRANQESKIELLGQRAWKMIGSTEVVGLALLLAGAVVALAPTTSSLETPSVAWFVTALHNVPTTRTASSLILGSAVILLAFGAIRFLRVTGRRLRTRNVASVVGLGLAGLGVVIGLSAWFSGHFHIPVSRVSVAEGQTVETIPTVQIGRTLNLMLPLKTQLLSIDTERATAKFRFNRAGESEGVEEEVRAGEPIVISDYRIALLGFEHDKRHLQVGLKSSEEETVPGRGAIGSEVQFKIDGPKYTVKNIARNYVGALGLAAELQDEDDKKFWVFEREPHDLKMSRGISIESVSTAPLAVFAVSSANIGPDFGVVAMVIFLIGFALFLGFPEPSEDSLNELGASRETT